MAKPTKVKPTYAATLTTPCTIQDLRVWLQNIDVIGVGSEKDSVINATTSQIAAT